uniref:Uncharacterized protein n=1 Tax=Knipowitschia caucasica TaxID=637954 RepID=A0AAV2IV06_KNICA
MLSDEAVALKNRAEAVEHDACAVRCACVLRGELLFYRADSEQTLIRLRADSDRTQSRLLPDGGEALSPERQRATLRIQMSADTGCTAGSGPDRLLVLL